MQMKEMMIASGSVRITTSALGQMEEKDDADDAHGDRELEDLFLQGIDGAVDQVGAVVGGDDLHPLGEARLDIVLDPLLDPFDDVEDVFPEPDDDDPARHLALAVEVGQAPPDLRAEPDVGRRPSAGSASPGRPR